VIFKNILLSLLILLLSYSVNAQNLTNNVLSAFKKHALTLDEWEGSDSLTLVKFSRPLSHKELLKFKPVRIFSATEYVIRSKYLTPGLDIVIYKNNVNTFWKASDQLIRNFESNNKSNKPATIRLVFNQLSSLPPYLKDLKVKAIDYTNRLIVVEILYSNLLSILAQQDVIYADIIPLAKEEIVINGIDLGLNSISAVHASFPAIDGKDVVLSVKEGMFDEKDIDFLGKIVSKQTSAQTSHATIMATLALGSGNSFIKGLGAAPKAKLASSSFTNLMPDDINQLKTLKVSVQNHSYGTDLDNTYGIEATAYDKQVFETDTLLHVFSAGNKGTATPISGVYIGLPNYANLTGNFKQSKNNLVIGGINRENVVETLSSKGPAYDGRIKPDLVALGEDGTSGAAAVSSGVVALLQQQYRTQFNKLPSSALIRSVLINSADDVDVPNVDYRAGFGRLNALNALKTISENRFKVAEIQSLQDYTFPIIVQSNQKQLKVSLVWNDPPAAINSAQSIVHHLDLSLETPSGQIILPWVLSTYPNLDSLAKPAQRKIDDLNTVQQLSLDQVTPGQYVVHIKARNLSQAKQAFALAYGFEAIDDFEFSYPQVNDALFANADNYIRWSATHNTNETGQLSVSYDNGNSWQMIASNVDLQADFFKWTTPSLFGRGMLKMQIGTKNYLSRSFVLSEPLNLKVGFDCGDKIQLHWQQQLGATSYTLYNIKNNELTAIATLTDTVALLNKVALSSPYFAVCANGAGFVGLKSYTIDYTLQGLSCYQQSFIATVIDSQIRLDLVIGSTYNLKKIIWEKQTATNVFSEIKTDMISLNKFSYNVNDLTPKKGVQRYRVTFETNDGSRFQSDIIAITYLKADEFVYYPNPVTQFLTIRSGSFEDYDLEIYDLIGNKILKDKGNGTKQFDLSKCLPGLYVGVISRDEIILQKIKVIKQ